MIREMLDQVKYNGGGHLNLQFFWESIIPISKGGGVEPQKHSHLRESINKAFGSWETFVTNFSCTSKCVRNSGNAWLVYNKNIDDLMIIQTNANTELLIKQSDEMVPLLTINAWVLQPYATCNANYMEDMWKMINWDMVASRLKKAKLESKYS